MPHHPRQLGGPALLSSTARAASKCPADDPAAAWTVAGGARAGATLACSPAH